MTIAEKISSAEKKYNGQIDEVLADILKRRAVKIILVAGPSCAGKTTTSKRLTEKLKENGKTAYTVSLDDFYRADIYKITDKNPDYEALSCLDLDLIHECLQKLIAGEKTLIPRFNFNTKTREIVYTEITLGENDFCIVEGIHALNPEIYHFVKPENIADIYLNTLESVEKSREVRLLRRLVRDYFHRSSDANTTFSLWKNVINGEKKYIEPFAYLADYKVYTYHDYEEGLLRPFAERILSENVENEYLSYKNFLLSEISDSSPVALSLVPDDSLMQEFIPQN